MRIVKALLTSVERLRARAILDAQEAASLAAPRPKGQGGGVAQRLRHLQLIASGKRPAERGMSALETFTRLRAINDEAREKGELYEQRLARGEITEPWHGREVVYQ